MTDPTYIPAAVMLAWSDLDSLRLAAALAIGIFVAVFITALFAQRGRAEMTPEREVALAAGHADRDTVFENSMLQPIMWLLMGLGRYLRLGGLRRWMRTKLVAAGSPNFYTSEEYLALCLLWGIVGAILGQVVNFMILHFPAWLVVPVSFVLGFLGGIVRLHTMAGRRTKEISRRVPYTLDLISLAMGAGATFTEAVRTVVQEGPDHPFNVELNTVLAEIELGTTRQQALRNMADRVPLEELRAIVAAIIQAEGLGTPLSDVLKEQANLMRLQRSVRAEKLAAQASVRILLPGILILISVVLTIFSPLIILFIRGKLF
jgi:tight adherence protein C